MQFASRVDLKLNAQALRPQASGLRSQTAETGGCYNRYGVTLMAFGARNDYCADVSDHTYVVTCKYIIVHQFAYAHSLTLTSTEQWKSPKKEGELTRSVEDGQWVVGPQSIGRVS